MISQIPLAAVPSQTLTTQLGTQNCRIDVSQKRTGLYLSLFVDQPQLINGTASLVSVPVITNILCLNLVRLVRRGIVGDLYFSDVQGIADPDYTGLADRFRLLYSDAL